MDPNDSFYPNYYSPYGNSQNSEEFSGYSQNFNSQFPPNLTQNSPPNLTPNNPQPEVATNKGNESVQWEPLEDVALMSAWVHVGGDAITGTNQTGDSLWVKVLKLYEQSRAENPGTLSKRSKESLRGRWSRLNKNVAKWIGCYREAYNQKTSGMSMADVESAAQQLYNNKKGFPHTLVFEQVMRHVPKWELNLGGDHRRPRPVAPDSEDEGHGSSKRSRTDDEDPAEPTPETPVSDASTISRPTGREAAKAKRKGKAKASSSSVPATIPEDFTSELRAMRITREKELEHMKETRNERKQIEEKRLEMENRRLNANMLSALLAKPNLTPQEEELKNRLLGLHMTYL